MVCRDHDVVAECVRAAVEVEIAVLADIGEGRRVGLSFVDDVERAARFQRIGAGDRAIARVAGTAVRIGDLERYAVFSPPADRPVALGDIVAAAVEMRGAALVELELIGLAFEREAAGADAVGVAAGVAPK